VDVGALDERDSCRSVRVGLTGRSCPRLRDTGGVRQPIWAESMCTSSPARFEAEGAREPLCPQVLLVSAKTSIGIGRSSVDK